MSFKSASGFGVDGTEFLARLHRDVRAPDLTGAQVCLLEQVVGRKQTPVFAKRPDGTMEQFAGTRAPTEPVLLLEKRSEPPAAARMLEFPKRLCLDLPDPLARHAELLADFLKRVIRVHPDAKSHAKNPFFTRRK